MFNILEFGVWVFFPIVNFGATGHFTVTHQQGETTCTSKIICAVEIAASLHNSMNFSTLVICWYIIRLTIFVRSFRSLLQFSADWLLPPLGLVPLSRVRTKKSFRFMRYNLLFAGPCCCCLFSSCLPCASRLISLPFGPLFLPVLMSN